MSSFCSSSGTVGFGMESLEEYLELEIFLHLSKLLPVDWHFEPGSG